MPLTCLYLTCFRFPLKLNKMYDIKHIDVIQRRLFKDPYSWTERIQAKQLLQLQANSKTTVRYIISIDFLPTKWMFVKSCFPSVKCNIVLRVIG